MNHWSHTWEHFHQHTQYQSWVLPQWGPHSQGTTLCVHLATAASRESNQPK